MGLNNKLRGNIKDTIILKNQNTRAIGNMYEELAVKYLADNGYNIIMRNFRCKMGEIDIVAVDSEVLCFIEVKYRKSNSVGFASAAVDKKKQEIIKKVAAFYLVRYGISEEIECRFDVVAIDEGNIELYKNAFGGMWNGLRYD